jgi:multidrug efflux pump subunit AcrA (membrane-fusion protein)
MRWRLLRRRLSISSPRMTVRSHMPWPLRWALAAVVLGFSGALALWAFEVGKGIAGLGHGSRDQAQALEQIRQQLDDLKRDRERAQSVANSADSLLKAERATQSRLAEQVKALELENQSLKDDLGFFERLLPASGEGLAVRGLQADLPAPGQLRYQLLVMQQGSRTMPEFKGRYEVSLSGLMDGKPWAMSMPVVSKPVQVRQYQRLDGMADYPSTAVVKQVQVRVLDEQGRVQTTQSLKL